MYHRVNAKLEKTRPVLVDEKIDVVDSFNKRPIIKKDGKRS